MKSIALFKSEGLSENGMSFKVKTVFLLVLFCIPSFTRAQVAWSTAGNALGAGGVLGTTSAQPVSFRTNNTERINFSSSGTIKFTGMTGTGSGLMQLASDGTASRLNYPNDALQLLNGNGSWVDYSTLSKWNLGSGLIYTTQKVGIGVSIPAQALEVSGNGIFSGSVSASSFDVGGIATVQGHLNISNSVIHHAYDATAGTRNEVYTTDHEYYINSNTSYNYNTLFNQGNTGKVGIGTNSPTDKLHVYGTARIQGQLKIDSLSIGDSLVLRSKQVSGMNILGLGKPATGFTFFIPTCVPYGTAHATNVVNGFNLAYAGTSGTGGSLTTGHNGSYALIQSYGSDSINGALKINYNCGNDVSICTGSYAGSVYMTTATGAGKVGIGTETPADKFQVKSGDFSLTTGSAAFSTLEYGTMYLGLNAARTGAGTWRTESDGANNGAAIIYSNVQGNIYFSSFGSTGGATHTGISDSAVLGNTKMYIASNGQLGIGTRCIPAAYKMAVDGKIICEGIRAQNNDSTGCWPDYVFEREYQRMSIEDLDKYVNTQKHLPGVPSAGEVSREGVDLVEMNKALLKATEENSLYIIELKKANDLLKEEIEALKALIQNKK